MTEVHVLYRSTVIHRRVRTKLKEQLCTQEVVDAKPIIGLPCPPFPCLPEAVEEDLLELLIEMK